MTDLIAKLESAESGSRGLSDEVLKVLGYTVRDKPISDAYADPYAKELVDPSGEVCGWFDENRPSPTESVDDALGLVPGKIYTEHDISMDRSVRGRETWEYWTLWQVRVAMEAAEDDPDETSGVWNGFAATLPLALCAALLRAHSHSQKE